MRENLRVKWMIFSILLAALPLAIAGFTLLRTYQENLKNSVIQIEKAKAHLVIERTQAFFEKASSSLTFLSREDHFKKNDFFHIKEHMKNFLSQYDSFIELTWLNGQGMEMIKVSKYEGRGPFQLRDRSRTGMFRAATKGRTYYGDLDITPDGTPTMVIAVPMKGVGGKSSGALVARIHLQSIWNLISETRIGESGFAYVVDSEGTLISHPDIHRVLMRVNMRHFPMVHRVIAGEEGSVEFEYPRGERSLFVFKPIQDLGWGVIVQVPLEEAYGPIKVMRGTAFLWMSISFLIAALFSFLFTRKLVYPIKQLSQEMTKVSRGDLKVHIKPATRDEIGLLTNSFNEMVQDLKSSQEALIETESKYRRIFENSRDMIYITSVDGKIVDINQAGVAMLGYDHKSELKKIYVKDIYFNPKDRERFQEEILQQGFVKDFEVKLRRRDGTPIDCLITASIRKEEERVILGYEGMIKDISYRKGIERELLQRTEELQTLYDLSALINQTLDLDHVFRTALEKAMSLTGFEMGAIYLLSEEKDVLEMKYHNGHPPAMVEEGKVLKYGEGVSGKAIALKQPMITSIDEYVSSRKAPVLLKEGIQTLVGFPLLAKGKGIGTITLLSRSPRELNQRKINLLESIGNQIGLALENAILFSAVAKAKSEWETTFDAVTDLIIIRDKDCRILRANKAAFKRYGLEPHEMIGTRCFEAFLHKTSPCDACYISETLRTIRPISGEMESQHLKGVFQYFTFPVFKEAGEVIGVVDLAREITEQKRMETEKEVVNNINKILASSLDMRKVIKEVHSEIKRITDSERMTLTLLERQGISLRYFAQGEDDVSQELAEERVFPKDGTPFSKAMETGQPVIVEDTGEDDSWINQKLFREGIRSSLVFPLEYKGRMIGTINFGSRTPHHFTEVHVRFLRQISTGLAISIENSLLLEEIKASEERYRTAVESAHDGVGVIGDDFRCKYASEKLAEILGYPREEIIEVDFRNFLDENSKQLVEDRYVRRQGGEDVPPRYEFNILRKDGEIRNVEISSSIVKDSKGSVNTICYIKDITERKKMEEQLLQTEKLRAVGEMATGIAHDFNNALAAILGNTQLLLHTIQDEEVRDTLETIERVAKDSAQTVRRLQDFTRKRVHQEVYKLDINTIINDTIEITRPKWKDEAQGKGIHIEILSHLGEIQHVIGIASEIREVITNMIFNAIEAMPEGGKIEIRTFQKKEKVYIQVSDTGLGMTEEVKKKVFEPFFTTKPFTNTGLGMSMSYGIIRRFGGELEVESRLGHGTTFTIILSVGSEEKDKGISTSLTQKGREARILVIDDEESVRSVLSKMLSQVNHHVTVARDGGEGLQLLKEKEFDIVLTDLGMPGMSGWDVCKAIKEMSLYIPVGMITGWGMELDQAKKEESGIDFVISKPFDFSQIVKVVSETMESRRKRSLS
jgi:PAS domain S-box-containing protein